MNHLFSALDIPARRYADIVKQVKELEKEKEELKNLFLDFVTFEKPLEEPGFTISRTKGRTSLEWITDKVKEETQALLKQRGLLKEKTGSEGIKITWSNHDNG